MHLRRENARRRKLLPRRADGLREHKSIYMFSGGQQGSSARCTARRTAGSQGGDMAGDLGWSPRSWLQSGAARKPAAVLINRVFGSLWCGKQKADYLTVFEARLRLNKRRFLELTLKFSLRIYFSAETFSKIFIPSGIL